MQGWFEDHYDRMKQYRHLATVAPVVGSKANGVLRKSLVAGFDVKYVIDPADFCNLKSGVRLASKILFAAGATKVFPSTYNSAPITREKDIDSVVDTILKPEDLNMTSAHPQGGNPMSNDPAIGAVGTDFRVHGFKNLFISDASVFPTSVHVNPQLTIMAVARYAADELLQH
jgi:choline dehydrogenase-like flavoprotein